MYEQNTRNKIAFCLHCMAPLTGIELVFCPNDLCARAFEDAAQKNPNFNAMGDKEYVYLNKAMLDLARAEGVVIYKQSAFIHTGNDMMGVALVERGKIQEISDSEVSTYDAYYREIPNVPSGMNLEPHNPPQLRQEGLFGYLGDHFGHTTERKIAEALRELTELENFSDPVELVNSL